MTSQKAKEAARNLYESINVHQIQKSSNDFMSANLINHAMGGHLTHSIHSKIRKSIK